MKVPVKTIETQRLILKELTSEHAADYYEGFVDYEVIRHIGGTVPWPYPKDGVDTYLKEMLPRQGKTLWQWGIFLKEAPNKLIGSISITKGDKNNRGFWLAKPYWGNGYMSEATPPVTEYAFTELGFNALRFTNLKGHARSRRLKEKEGAMLVKTVPSNSIDPGYTHTEHWALTKQRWKEWSRR